MKKHLIATRLKKPLNLSRPVHPMSEEQYWRLIKHLISWKKGTASMRIDFLKQKLMELSPEEIIGFDLRRGYLMGDLHTPELLGVISIIEGECFSDDDIGIYKLGLITQGNEVYEKAKTNPDSLFELIDLKNWYGKVYDPKDEGALIYVAENAFLEKTGHDMFDHFDWDSLPDLPNITLPCEGKNLATLQAICPKTFKAFGREKELELWERAVIEIQKERYDSDQEMTFDLSNEKIAKQVETRFEQLLEEKGKDNHKLLRKEISDIRNRNKGQAKDLER